MIRSFFLSMGLIVGLVGVGCLGIDRIVLKTRADKTPPAGLRAIVTGVSADRKQVIQPPEWAAYALMSAGGVMTLYTLTLPGGGKAKKSKGD